MVNLEKLLRQEEYESLDFKQQFHENNLKLLHDILCLANAYIEADFSRDLREKKVSGYYSLTQALI